MSVTLNEAALVRLLDSEEGPVGEYVQRLAEAVVAQAQGNVRDYFHSAPSLTVDQDVGFSMEGSKAIIGMRDRGDKSRRLSEAQADGDVNWLLLAFDNLGA